MSFLIRPVRAKETRPYPRHVRDHKAKIWEINWSAPMVGKRHNYPKQRPWGIISAPSPSLTHAATCRWPNCRVGRGGRVRQKVFLCLVLTSGKPNYHQHNSGLCRSIRRPTPPKPLHIIVGTKSWFLFLSVWWSVSCRAVWVWGREEVKTGELSIHRGVRYVLGSTKYAVRWFNFVCQQQRSLCGNSSACRTYMKANREETKKGHMHIETGDTTSWFTSQYCPCLVNLFNLLRPFSLSGGLLRTGND